MQQSDVTSVYNQLYRKYLQNSRNIGFVIRTFVHLKDYEELQAKTVVELDFINR